MEILKHRSSVERGALLGYDGEWERVEIDGDSFSVIATVPCGCGATFPVARHTRAMKAGGQIKTFKRG